jgi:hypothetical protein
MTTGELPVGRVSTPNCLIFNADGSSPALARAMLAIEMQENRKRSGKNDHNGNKK